jgi:hypothetical protein
MKEKLSDWFDPFRKERVKPFIEHYFKDGFGEELNSSKNS